MPVREIDGVCRQSALFELLGRKWTVTLLHALEPRELRFGELQRRVPSIKHKVLTQALRQLEAGGLVERRTRERQDYSAYALTVDARELLPIVEALEQWCAARPNGDGGTFARTPSPNAMPRE